MRILDLYLLGALLASMLFTLLALSLIFIVVNLIESLDRFLDQRADGWTIALYYIYFLPEIVKLLLPVTVLVAVLFAVGKLTESYETTAMKSAGMSLYRIMAPIILLCSALSAGHLYFNGWIVPRVLTKKFAIERQYLGRNSGGFQEQLYNLYLRDTPKRIVAIGFYDLRSQRGKDLSVEEYSDDMLPHPVRRIDALSFRWDSATNEWIADQCFIRAFDSGVVRSAYHTELALTLATDHNRLRTLQRSMEEMTLTEQADYIDFLRRGGRNTRQLDIAHAGDYAFPLANVIVALIAAPFASIKKRSGLAANIAAAMTMTFSYLVLTKVTQSLGMETTLPPELVGWSANIIFTIVAAIVLIRTPT